MSSSHFLHPLALLSILGQPLRSNPIPYTTLFRSQSRNDTQDNSRNQRGQNRQAENGRDDMRQAARQDSSRSTSRQETDRKSTRLNSSHVAISYAVFSLKKKIKEVRQTTLTVSITR